MGGGSVNSVAGCDQRRGLGCECTALSGRDDAWLQAQRGGREGSIRWRTRRQRAQGTNSTAAGSEAQRDRNGSDDVVLRRLNVDGLEGLMRAYWGQFRRRASARRVTRP